MHILLFYQVNLLVILCFITRLRQSEGQYLKSTNQNALLPVQYSLSIGPGIFPKDPKLVSLWTWNQFQSYNKSLINQACSEPYWENIGPWSFLYGPRCARSVLSRPRTNILPLRPSRLVNKIYTSYVVHFDTTYFYFQSNTVKLEVLTNNLNL